MDCLELDDQQIGVGPTKELSLRASVATLVRVMFNDLVDGNRMVALERTATLREIQGKTEATVIAKPFGGAVRLINPQQLIRLIGNFHFDSERSRQEGDFRILINPASWAMVREICRENLKKNEYGILNSNPERELFEEFEDTLNIRLTRDQYQLKPRGIIVEGQPIKTDSVRAAGLLTARIYYIFDAWVDTPELVKRMVANSEQYSDADLQKIAWDDAQRGGRGRANAILTLELDALTEMYRSMPMDERSEPIRYEEHGLAGNVLAILQEVDQSRYKRLMV